MNNIFYDMGMISLWPFDLENYLKIGIKSDYFSWWTDSEVTKYNSHGLFPHSIDDYNNWLQTVKSNEVLVLGVIHNRDKKHIGNVSLQSFDWINRSAEIAIVMGEPDYWGKGFGYVACKKMIEHAFDRLNIMRIWSGTSVLNVAMNKIFKRLGFKNEGVFKQAQYLDGDYYDINIYGLLKEHYKLSKLMDC